MKRSEGEVDRKNVKGRLTTSKPTTKKEVQRTGDCLGIKKAREYKRAKKFPKKPRKYRRGGIRTTVILQLTIGLVSETIKETDPRAYPQSGSLKVLGIQYKRTRNKETRSKEKKT